MAYGMPADGVNVLVPGDVDQEMQADIDAQWGNQGQQGQPQQPMPDPAVLLQQMMSQMMQNMMNQMNHMFAQAAPGVIGQSPGGSSAAFSPQGADPRNWQGPPNTGGWQYDKSLSNVRFDERAFRRIDKFTDKPSEWTEWKAQMIEAVRECDKTFADDLAVFEKKERVWRRCHFSSAGVAFPCLQKRKLVREHGPNHKSRLLWGRGGGG